jgi:tryptophan 7-halogenase
MRVDKLVIVGGGSAGWMAATFFARVMAQRPGGPLDITVVESANIPRIGVGEATVPTMKAFLKRLGISEGEFLRETDGTFKQAIKFPHWLHDPDDIDQHYYHPFHNPILEGAADMASFWVQQKLAGETALNFADATSFQPSICEAGLGPKRATDPDFEGPLQYAYHFDAFKFATYLTKFATNLGVKHIVDDVVDVALKENGYVKSVKTRDHGDIEGDLFIDCTGFSAVISEKAMGVPFVDYNWSLFCDKAVTIRAPYADPNHKITPYTTATAQKAGWIWDIQLQGRRGVGHVYSSSHMSDDDAEIAIRKYIGDEANDIEAQVIPIKVGHRKEFWHKNCVSIGLSGAFVEPLESTGIYLIEMMITLLGDYFPTNGGFEKLSPQYNRVLTSTIENVIAFVKMHYCLTQRKDTDFWIENTNPDTYTEALKQVLDTYDYLAPPKYEPLFPAPFARPSSFAYILYGLEFEPKAASGHGTFFSPDFMQQAYSSVQQGKAQALANLPDHNELIRQMCAKA